VLIKRDPDIIKGYFEDYSNLKGGHAEKIVFPEDIGELSQVLKEANSSKTPVTVSGGGTGTTGSRIPFGGIVVSMERFNKILRISGDTMSSVVQAGVTVEDFKRACEEKGLFYTSHPTEKSACIGGTVSTNASGSRSFKYGPTRRYVKRLKMALATGEIFEIGRGERTITGRDSAITLASGAKIKIPIPHYRVPDIKNSAGYFAKDGMDLIDLFIGQEGTLSVISEIELELVNNPAKIFSAFAFFKTEEDAWAFAAAVRTISKASRPQSLPAIRALSVEYFDKNALGLLRDKNVKIPRAAAAAIFFEQEVDASNEDAVIERWLKVIQEHRASLDDTWAAMNEKEADDFTRFRHHIPEAVNEIIRQNGFQKLSTDIAVPEGAFMEMLNFYSATLKTCDIAHVVFGHIGECHVHVNLLPKNANELRRAKDICVSFIRKAVSLGGTISAEHGVGKTKHDYLLMMYGEDGVREMARIKKALDPNCILGLDNIFPRELLSRV